tara:strand:- start:5565 stop:6662 length:1098 start_codon:yes stop_codon:yes gene_type:complete
MNKFTASSLVDSNKAISFDDIMIVPTDSSVISRSNPSTSSVIASSLTLDIPVISSPMDTVTGSDMAKEMSVNGAAGIIHRFASKEDQSLMIQSMIDTQEYEGDLGGLKVIPAIGVGNSEKDRFEFLYRKFGDKLTAVAVDVANGDSGYMRDMVMWLKRNVPNLPVIAGNVATGEAFNRLSDAGANAIRVGIGGGSICKTRIMTGIGVPTLSSVIDCVHHRSLYGDSSVSIIADGGIRYPADFVKSLAVGADAIIAGRIFAGTIESPGDISIVNGVKTKVYRGMASKEVQDDKRGGLRPGTCAEGVSTYIPLKGKAKYVLNDFSGGLRSAMTYVNALNLQELRDNSRFIKITASGLDESHAFGTKI